MATVLNKIWGTLKAAPAAVYKVLGVVVLTLIALFYKDKARRAEGKANAAEAQKTDARLEQQQKDLQKKNQEIQQQDEEAKKNVSSDPDELAKDLNKI